MNIDIDKHYTTRNTSLAACLYMKGFYLIDVDITNSMSIFVFEKTKQLLECAKLFQISEAEGNLSHYFEAYRKCLMMTKVGKL